MDLPESGQTTIKHHGLNSDVWVLFTQLCGVRRESRIRILKVTPSSMLRSGICSIPVWRVEPANDIQARVRSVLAEIPVDELVFHVGVNMAIPAPLHLDHNRQFFPERFTVSGNGHQDINPFACFTFRREFPRELEFTSQHDLAIDKIAHHPSLEGLTEVLLVLGSPAGFVSPLFVPKGLDEILFVYVSFPFSDRLGDDLKQIAFRTHQPPFRVAAHT